MKSFFKTLGAGVGYTIVSPIFIAILALAMAYALIRIIIGAAMIPIYFFNGKNYFGDPKARLLAERKTEAQALGSAPSNFNFAPPPVNPYPNQPFNNPQGGYPNPGYHNNPQGFNNQQGYNQPYNGPYPYNPHNNRGDGHE